VLPGFLTDENKRAAWSRVRFRGDGKLSMDPAREAKALEIHEAHGWSTGAQITAELNGGDYDANVTARIAEHQRFVAGGLPIPNVVGGGNGLPEATDTTDNIAGSGSADADGTGTEGN
jgi:capsid protein